MKWKILQRFDAEQVGLITNAERAARPDWPDGVSIKMALKQLGADLRYLREPISGWFPESKCGYHFYTKEYKEFIKLSRRCGGLLLCPVEYKKERLYILRKGNFFSCIIAPVSTKTTTQLYSGKIPKIYKFLYDALLQAEGYLSAPGIDSDMRYPFVGWHPKDKYLQYVDGVVMVRREVFFKWRDSFVR
jgi:hypothetical protein